ncbi:unnamed protein product [Ceutorhynchus assimilis]|uniref:Uncharacterized protein n=1 Tax=Ceutorhynchus assimilis TaxID=467358 RepID=A0A9N9MLX0_9CUCU|nr:unnamed protein product [Ceutorhynchus assimilis]
MHRSDSDYRSYAPSYATSLRNYSLSVSRGNRSILLPVQELAEPMVIVPPDGGWGWIVVAASLIIMFCADGIQYCFALFLDDISKDLNEDLTQVALVASLVGGFYYLSGPITCSSVNRFGFQKITFLGGLLSCIAFCAASYAKSLVALLVVLGILGGTAFNLMYTPSLIAIGFYFEHWRALAMAITCCGSSLGVTCFPVIVQALQHLTWRTKFRYFSGMFVICGLLGWTFRPLKATKVDRFVQFGEVEEIESKLVEDDNEMTGIVAFFRRFKNALFPTISEASLLPETMMRGSVASSVVYSLYMQRDVDDTLSTFLRADENDPSDKSENMTEDNRSRRQSEAPREIVQRNIRKSFNERFTGCCETFNNYSCSPCCTRARDASVSVNNLHVNRPLYRDDIFYTGSIVSAATLRNSRFGSRQTAATSRGYPSLAYTLSVTRAATQRDLQQQGRCVICPDAVIRVLVTMLDFHMLKSPAFVLLLVSGYLSLMGTYLVFTYIPSYGREKGLDPQFNGILISVIGIPNTVGRAACGIMSCFPALDTHVTCWVCISISGISVIASYFLSTPIQFSIAYGLFGFTIATFAVLRAVAFAELFGLENLTNCFGWNMIFQSLAAFSATPVGNLIYYKTGQFSYVILFTGIILLISGLIIIPIERLLRWEKNRRR